jgi:hypothetical protein
VAQPDGKAPEREPLDTQVRLLSLTDLNNKASGHAQIPLPRRITGHAQLQAS